MRQLQDVRARVPGPRQHPQADAGGQGRQRRRARPGPRRLGLARTESFARLGSAFAPLVNAAAGQPRRPLAAGEAVRRVAPAAAAGASPAAASCAGPRRRGWTRRPRSARPRVAYFVDVFANYNDPLIAEAVVAVLHHNGIEVYVPPGQVGCGMAPLAYGDVETARETVQHNLRVLADLAREGYPILCSEPTAALMLRHDALDLLDDPDARLVADADGRVAPRSCGTCTSRASCAPTSSRSTSRSAITFPATSRRWAGRPRARRCCR